MGGKLHDQQEPPKRPFQIQEGKENLLGEKIYCSGSLSKGQRSPEGTGSKALMAAGINMEFRLNDRAGNFN